MSKLTKGEETKKRIIKCAADLFFRNGYNATGISEILKAADIPKGSFYFHFNSKKSLAEDVAKYYEEELTNWIMEYYSKYKGSEFIDTFIGSMIEKAERNEYYGCPLTTIGQELAFFEPDIAETYKTSLEKLLALFIVIFKKKGKKNYEALGKKAFVMYEGYLVYYRISKNVDILIDMQRDMHRLFAK